MSPKIKPSFRGRAEMSRLTGLSFISCHHLTSNVVDMDGCCSDSHSRKGLLPAVGSGVSWQPLAVSSFRVCISCRTMTSLRSPS